jgi:ribosomal protein S6
MIRYEVLILAHPELGSDDASNLERQFEKTVKDHEGSVISYDRWGKYRLAYAVNGEEYGIYYLARFQADEKKLQELVQALKTLYMVRFNTIVLRHMIARLAPGASLEYQRPESLEEAPSREQAAMAERAQADDEEGEDAEIGLDL